MRSFIISLVFRAPTFSYIGPDRVLKNVIITTKKVIKIVLLRSFYNISVYTP